MGNGTPRYERLYSVTAGQGGRQMPCGKRTPSSGARDVCTWGPPEFPPVSSNTLTKTTGPASTAGNVFSDAYWAANATGRLDSLIPPSTICGIGGGDNESGTSFGLVLFPVGSEQGTAASQSGLTSAERSLLVSNNIPYMQTSQIINSNPTQYYIMAGSGAGGGGWGASGGNFYGIVSTDTLRSYNPATSTNQLLSTGGAGGPAVKTNGHAVTWVGGQGTNRVFGAIA